ncbi:hypothetical protein GCM10007981_07070 [Thermocladium modestius]|uniref:Uncharacterized protein n=1 Tax=Thermocladium modestius TaxID=62609 RepID=A0A830GV45_9CREN|nr:hypothetical protein [Thermocladium modestius]GGP20152.1 hypothetical protein GCM10007981_07070 [Thermocladium modestius]
MNNLIIVVIALVAVGGIVIAEAAAGNLAYITYTITSKFNPQPAITPANFNLGNLTAGSGGVITETATVMIPSNGSYVIFLRDKPIEDSFSSFNVTIKISSYTISLSEENDSTRIYLSKGTYSAVITISYTVSSDANNKTVINQPFLSIRPIRGTGNDEHNSTSTETSTANETDAEQ